MQTGKKLGSTLFRISAAAGLLLMATAANAGYTGSVKITQLQMSPGGTILYISSSTTWPNPGNCTNTTSIAVDGTVSNFNLLATMLYDAYANGNLVNFYISNTCLSNGNFTFPLVQQIQWVQS